VPPAVPIMIGGMGVDISTASTWPNWRRPIAWAVSATSRTRWSRPCPTDRRYDTKYVKDKLKLYKYNVANDRQVGVKFDLGLLAEATRLHVRRTMARKRGDG
jgi:nitronate monooxygenase